MSIAGLIVAGGRGRRVGGGKPLLPFRGARLIDAVIARARPQVDALALNVPHQSRSGYEGYGLPLLCDADDSFGGPLSGVAAGLRWLQDECTWLASFPCDTPFLPPDLVTRLAAARDGTRPVVIKAGAEIHALCALWPREALPMLQSSREKSVRRVLSALDAITVPVASDDPGFFNINTPEDLAEAERMAAAAP
jgi:molybdopterin-guanine dinucleotide biosynthesis protein A